MCGLETQTGFCEGGHRAGGWAGGWTGSGLDEGAVGREESGWTREASSDSCSAPNSLWSFYMSLLLQASASSPAEKLGWAGLGCVSSVPPAPGVNLSFSPILSAFVTSWHHAKSSALKHALSSCQSHPERHSGEQDGHSPLIHQILSAYCM